MLLYKKFRSGFLPKQLYNSGMLVFMAQLWQFIFWKFYFINFMITHKINKRQKLFKNTRISKSTQILNRKTYLNHKIQFPWQNIPIKPSKTIFYSFTPICLLLYCDELASSDLKASEIKRERKMSARRHKIALN